MVPPHIGTMWLAQRNLNCVADLASKINARAEINFDNEHALNPLACKDPRLAAHCLRRDNPLDFPLRAKTRKAQCEQMLSALPPRADIAQRSRHVRFVPKAEVYPQQSVQPATRHPSTWAQQAPRRLGTTRTRTDADGSRAIRNGRFQRPVPQLLRQKHQS